MKKVKFNGGREKKRLSKIKLITTIIVMLSIGLFIYDIVHSQIQGSLPAEAPVAGMLLNPQTIPEPKEQLNDAQADQAANQEIAPDTEAAMAETEAIEELDSFYSEYRLEREKVRAEALELLQSIVDDPHSSVEMRDTATKQKLNIARNLEYELMTENVLAAKNFGETVVMIGEGTVTVVVSIIMDDLKSAQIAEAVAGVTGVDYENVIIINRE